MQLPAVAHGDEFAEASSGFQVGVQSEADAHQELRASADRSRVPGAKSVVGLDVSGIDPAFKEHAQRGIGRYVRELLKFFEASQGALASQSFEVATFSHRSLQGHGGRCLRAAAALIERAPILRATLRQQLLYPYQLSHAIGNIVGQHGTRTGGGTATLDVVHFPAHMDAPAWGLSRYAITVLDLIPLVCADLYKAAQVTARYRFARWLELSAIRNASIVLCISAHTARDVHRLLGVPWERLVITPLGVDAESFAHGSEASADTQVVSGLKSDLGISPTDFARPIVLYVGGIDPRKNIAFLVQAFSEVLRTWRAESHGPAPLLVMAGNIQGDREFPALQAVIARLGLARDVVLPGYVDDKTLRMLYASSAAFFFPSLYEGFGLPPLEAMAAGLPVVSSDSSAMPEVLGEAAVLFKPTAMEDAVRGLREVLTNSELVQRLRVDGQERAKLFTWNRTGEATLHAYHRLIDQGVGRTGGGEFVA